MSRPPKKRLVMHRPRYMKFGPTCWEYDKNGSDDKVYLEITVDELEAIRLADLEGYAQEDAAKLMEVSRQTFGRIIENARKQVADALVNGKILTIKCDDFIEFHSRTLKCIECAHEWMDNSGPDEIVTCPKCGAESVIKMRRCGRECKCPLVLNQINI